jgi:hypothetical protein
MSVYARHFKGQGWGGRIHRRDPKGRDLWPGFWNSINLCFPNFKVRGRAGGSTERTQRGAAATLIPRYSPRENIRWAHTLGQYGTGFQGPVRFPLACSALPGAAPASRRASRRLG